RLQKAYSAMAELEKGAIANPDEDRMVGHYWLRAPQLAPDDWGSVIENTLEDLKNFAAQIHDGEITPQRGGKFENLLVVGIGGSAGRLSRNGPALRSPRRRHHRRRQQTRRGRHQRTLAGSLSDVGLGRWTHQ